MAGSGVGGAGSDAGAAGLTMLLTREYLSGVPVRTTSVQLRDLPTAVAAHDLVAQVFRHPVAEGHPPSPKHTLSWGKAVLKVYSAAGEDPDALYEIVAEGAAASAAAEWHFRDFCASTDFALAGDADWWVCLRESTNMISGGTTGLSSWGAAAALAEWACANPQEVDGRAVVELGCGPGLVGLAIARGCSPSSVTLTDGADMVIELAEVNVSQNLARWKGSPPVTVERLDWLAPHIVKGDLIVAADVVYDPGLIGPLVDTLVLELGRPLEPGEHSPSAVVACTERNAETWQLFRDTVTAKQLNVELLDLPVPHLFPRDPEAILHILKLTMA